MGIYTENQMTVTLKLKRIEVCTVLSAMRKVKAYSDDEKLENVYKLILEQLDQHDLNVRNHRTQSTTLSLMEILSEALWDEVRKGKAEDGILQQAVNVQIMVNRIVWQLNKLRGEEQNDADN